MDKLYSIGEISKLINISKDALRYYDLIGLFPPKHVDKETNYRYYSFTQLEIIIRISELKELDFSLKEIKEILSLDESEIKIKYFKKANQLLIKENEIKRKIEKLNHYNNKIENSTTERKNYMLDNKKTLIIDDSETMNNILKDFLAAEGYNIVAQAKNGKIGLEMFKHHKPDYILLDLMMPEMDGIECLRRIRDVCKDVKIIIVTARNDDETKNLCVSLGADAYVTKPFKREQLILAVQSL